MINRMRVIMDALSSDNKIVTGIGSRKTNRAIDYVIRQLSLYLAGLGFTVRSGGAEGSDDSFETDNSREIYLPWDGFNGKYKSKGDYILPDDLYVGNITVSNKATKLAKKYFKGYEYVSSGVKALQRRNMHQVLGRDLNTPTGSIFCYTADGCDSMFTRTSKTGGTGTAISLADDLNIPIINLGIYENMLLILYLLKIPMVEEKLNKNDLSSIDMDLCLHIRKDGDAVYALYIKDFK